MQENQINITVDNEPDLISALNRALSVYCRNNARPSSDVRQYAAHRHGNGWKITFTVHR